MTEQREKLKYVKSLIVDERHAKGWIKPIVWIWKMEELLSKDQSCSDTMDFRRSPIHFGMRQIMMNYFESNTKYADYNWIQEIMDTINQNDHHSR